MSSLVASRMEEDCVREQEVSALFHMRRYTGSRDRADPSQSQGDGTILVQMQRKRADGG